METINCSFVAYSSPISQLRPIQTRIKRLRRVAHTPSRAWALEQIWLNFNAAMHKAANTPFNELLLVDDSKDIQKDKRPQKPNKYSCWACI